jgi:hypothetical protein
LAANGLLSVHINVPLRNISGTPLRSWNVRLQVGGEEELELFAFAQLPSKPQSFDIQLNPQHLKLIHSAALPVISMQVQACNALQEGEYSSPPSKVQVTLPKPKAPTPQLSARSGSKEGSIGGGDNAPQDKAAAPPAASNEQIRGKVARATGEQQQPAEEASAAPRSRKARPPSGASAPAAEGSKPLKTLSRPPPSQSHNATVGANAPAGSAAGPGAAPRRSKFGSTN